MLNRDNERVVAHQDAMQRSVQFLAKQPWSTIITVLVIALTLMLAALSSMVTRQVAALGDSWQNSGHISLYLVHHDVAAADAQFLMQVRSTPGVAAAVLTSAAEGLTLLSQQDGMEDMLQYLPENPLPAVIEVTPDASLTTPAALDRLYQSLKAMPQVEEAKFDRDWVGRLYAALSFLTDLTRVLEIVLAVTVVLVIGNTLRLIIYHRHEEIQVLQLLGATDRYIMRPFLYSGIWYGLLAACLAIVFVDIFIVMLRKGINQWAEIYQMHFSLPMMSFQEISGLILLAISLGWLGARVTVKRYL